ncbi:MAG: aminoacyl-tRNA hydrolase [Verrucomicrobiota bacterium]|nr:aminoacyl-tRNA hydrolase [Verrucomicrobiota bacterium]
MEENFLIVGLGNPGKEYANTRHNIGFMTIERLAKHFSFDWQVNKKFTTHLARGDQDGKSILLTKPQKYMNLSGKTVAPLAGYYKIHAERVMVVVDDLDLPLGSLRMRPDGGNGGHRGLESISECLGTCSFPRLRIGIGRPDRKQEVSGFVLGQFSQGEMDRVETVIETASNQLSCWINQGLQMAMNNYNGDLFPNK